MAAVYSPLTITSFTGMQMTFWSDHEARSLTTPCFTEIHSTFCRIYMETILCRVQLLELLINLVVSALDTVFTQFVCTSSDIVANKTGDGQRPIYIMALKLHVLIRWLFLQNNLQNKSTFFVCLCHYLNYFAAAEFYYVVINNNKQTEYSGCSTVLYISVRRCFRWTTKRFASGHIRISKMLS